MKLPPRFYVRPDAMVICAIWVCTAIAYALHPNVEIFGYAVGGTVLAAWFL